MVKIVAPPEQRKSKGVSFYRRDGLDYARVSRNALYRALVPSIPAGDGVSANQNILQRALGDLRGQILRNFARTRQGFGMLPDWRWNSGCSWYLEEHPDDPAQDSPKEWLNAQYAPQAWSNTVSKFGIWQDWDKFLPSCVTAIETDYSVPEWAEYLAFERENMRVRLDPIEFDHPAVDGGVIPVAAVRLLCFMGLGVAGYPVGNVFLGKPPWWCQYRQDENGLWERICVTPVPPPDGKTSESAE